jgi:hypothetical protein
MPIITITKIADQTKTSAKGKKYKVVHVEGTKYGSEEEWSTDIFKNDTAVLDQLDDFGPGELANFKFKKNGNFWDLKTIEEPSEENLEYAADADNNYKKSDSGGGRKSTGGKSKKGGSSTSSGLSKEEWAAKDRATKESIARAVAVKLAMDNTKEGAPVKTIIKQAVKYLPFLMGEDEILFDKVPNPEDALDPPTE